jgi:Cu/Ag efflux protein CusF
MKCIALRSAALLVALGLGPGYGTGYIGISRADDPPAAKQPALKLTARAKIASIDSKTNQVKLRTEDDKPLLVTVDEQTKIRLNDREIAFKDLREGLEVAVVYQTVNGRNMASALNVASTLEPPPAQTESPSKGSVAVIRAPKQMKVTGVVSKVMQASNSFVLRQADGHEDTYYLENTATAADLQEGATLTVVYQVRNVVNSVGISSADGTTTAVPRTSETATQAEGGAVGAAGFTIFEGDFVRAVPEEGFVILKSREGKERKFFTQKSTTFMLNNKKAQLADFQAGSPVSVQFKSVNGRDTISNFSSMPRATPATPSTVRPR